MVDKTVVAMEIGIGGVEQIGCHATQHTVGRQSIDAVVERSSFGITSRQGNRG